MTTPTTNSSREVDTTLPEFSWIPFFRELAIRLNDDGWEHRQQEIAEALQKMRRSIKVHRYVDRLEGVIDPFSLMALFNRGIAFDSQVRLAEAFRGFFQFETPFATERPFLPTVNPTNCFYFSGNRLDEPAVHWNTLRLATKLDPRSGGPGVNELIHALNESISVTHVGAAKLSSALYWVAPTQFLRTDTIDAVLGDWPGYPHGPGFGERYLERLDRLTAIDARPFPHINNEQRLINQFEGAKDLERVRVYSLPKEYGAPQGGGASALAIVNGAPTGAFESIRRGDVVLATESDGNYRYGFSASSRSYGVNDGEEAQLSCRTVYWRPELIEAPDFHLIPGNSVEPVEHGKVDLLLRILGKESPPPERPCPWSQVFVDSEDLTQILRLLREKRNLVLQGPPGVGKTFVALKLARTLVAEVNNEENPCPECELEHGAADDFEGADKFIHSVQFHQSYSYEDFVGGFKPGSNEHGQLIFVAEDGAFLRLCERARSKPNQRFVMLIDEVNRGNLSRVFGELMMLIEPDKRNKSNAVELQHRRAMTAKYVDAMFHVPKNVYIIGTMNLADRSLTGMNVAMRRRFAFFRLSPQFGNAKFAHLVQNRGMPPEIQRRIIERLPALNQTIAKDYALGRQYAVGHSFFVPTTNEEEQLEWEDEDWEKWYESVLEFEVRPLLEEYWFDAPDTAIGEIDKLRRDDGPSDNTD